MPALGTRSISRQRQGHPPGQKLNSILTGDAGMTKRIVGVSLTFSTAGTITGANNTFPASGPGAFAVGDPIEIIGTLLNAAFFTVIGLDAANHSFLTVDPPPKNEGPLTVTIRTV